MAFLLISGLGPFRSHSEHLAGTLLGRDFDGNTELQQQYARMVGFPLDLRKLRTMTRTIGFDEIMDAASDIS